MGGVHLSEFLAGTLTIVRHSGSPDYLCLQYSTSLLLMIIGDCTQKASCKRDTENIVAHIVP